MPVDLFTSNLLSKGSYVDDHELIGYSETHCQTQRAMFTGAQLQRMFDLAGMKPSQPLVGYEWYSMQGDMLKLCSAARANLRRSTFEVIDGGKT